MSKSFCAVAVVAVLAFSANLALAHGGVFQGPMGGGTPTFGGPAGGGTPGGPGGGTGGGQPAGPGGATGGGGSSGGGATPGGAGPPRPGGGGGGRAGAGSRTGGGKAKADTRNYDWDWWWELNDDQFLKLKAHIRSAESASSNADDILGKGDSESVAKVTTTQIRNQILPVVRLGMRDDYFDARAGAVIAAGKIADTSLPELPEIVAEIRKLLADENYQVQESACLGLGILGDKEAVPDLIRIMKNDPKARQLCGEGTKDIAVRQRAFAAAAIGLIGAQVALDASVANELLEMTKKRDTHPDLQVFPALALGVMRVKDAVPELQKIVANVDNREVVRAHAAVALGKLGDKSSVAFLAKDGLTDKDNHVQRSAAVALGLLTDREDTKTVDIVIRHAESASDRSVRNFCIIALGQIGHIKGRDFLVQKIQRGQPHDRTFAAMALGVYGYKFKESRNELGQILLKAWKEVKNDSERGAFAIGMGLLDYKPGIPSLMEEMKAGGSPDLKGHVATALGLLGHKDAIPLVQELAKRVSDTDAQRRASIALGLIGDPEAVSVLIKVIEDAQGNLSALGGAAVALGFIGDRKAVATLAEMLEKREKYKPNARAFGGVALGILGDKSDIPLLSRYQESCNYLATTDSLNELLLIY